MALAGLTHRVATMEKKQDEILGLLRSGPPGALSSSGAAARLNPALLTGWAKSVINPSKIVDTEGISV